MVYTYPIMYMTGFYTFEVVVWDFFHQQYLKIGMSIGPINTQEAKQIVILLRAEEIPNNHLEIYKNPVVNNGRTHQPQLVQNFFHQQYLQENSFDLKGLWRKLIKYLALQLLVSMFLLQSVIYLITWRIKHIPVPES